MEDHLFDFLGEDGAVRDRRFRRRRRLRRGRCLSDCCLFGCRCVVVPVGVVGRMGCLSLLLTKAVFHGVPLQTMLRRGEPSRVVRNADTKVFLPRFVKTFVTRRRAPGKSDGPRCHCQYIRKKQQHTL